MMHITNQISQYFGKFAKKEFPTPIQKIINLSYELMEVKLNGKKKLYNFHEMKKRINSKIKNKELNSEINCG